MRKATAKKTEAMEILNVLGIGDKANVYPGILSGGEKRKVSIACAFIGNTQVGLKVHQAADQYNRQ